MKNLLFGFRINSKMFSPTFHKRLIKYSIIFVLLQCMAQVQAVERWEDEDHFMSGRRLLEFTDDSSDIMIFFIVFVAGILITFPLVRYMCQNGYCGDDSTSDPDIHAIVHPPPRQLVQQPQLHVSYHNTGFVHSPVVSAGGPSPPVGFIADDKPPEYSAVVMSDLQQGAQQTAYPIVAPRY